MNIFTISVPALKLSLPSLVCPEQNFDCLLVGPFLSYYKNMSISLNFDCGKKERKKIHLKYNQMLILGTILRSYHFRRIYFISLRIQTDFTIWGWNKQHCIFNLVVLWICVPCSKLCSGCKTGVVKTGLTMFKITMLLVS